MATTADMQLINPGTRDSQQPLFIFLPGMDGSGQLLHRQVEGLGSCFDVRCLSLPVNDLSNWNSLVERVIPLIEAEQQSSTRPVHLCGESFGGCLAMQVASHRPALFQSLTLVNPASSFNRVPLFRWGSPLSNLLPTPLYKLSSGILGHFLVEPERVALEDRQALMRAMVSVSPKTAAWRLHLLRQFRLDQIGLEQLSLPVLLIAGERDRLLPSVSEIRRIGQHLTQAQTHLLPHSGHACLLEKAVNLRQIMQQQPGSFALPQP